MLRRNPDGWSVWRQALFAFVPVLLGAGVMVAGDGPATTPGVSRIEATRPAPAPAGPAAADPVLQAVVGEPLPATSEAALPSPPSTVTAAVSGAAVALAPAVVAGEARPPAAPAVAAPTTTVPATATGPASTVAATTTVPPPLATTTTTTPARRSPQTGAAAEVVPLTNADRTAAGLQALARNACLDSVASGFAEQMARSGVLAHNAGAGAGVLGCRPGAAWGDNVGRAVPCDAALLEREWMASPGHRRNILTAAFTNIGVGAWTGDDGTCWIQVLFSS